MRTPFTSCQVIGASAPVGKPPEAAGDGPKGAPSSNTAPANWGPTTPETIRTGIDSLYLSYRGALKPAWDLRLAELKLLAQSQRIEDQLQAQLALGGHLLQVRDRGRGRFSYVLEDNWFTMALAARSSPSLPVAHVQIGNEVLVIDGPQKPVDDLTALVSEIADLTGPPLVSRVDLAADFLCAMDLESIGEESWVSRARSKAKRYESGQFTGWTFGMGGNLSARLYNKSVELRKSGKTYMYEVWAANGWRGEADVWRMEFQLRREPLKELGISIQPDLAPNVGRVWRYCCESWLRLEV